jgi:mannose-1-phosphate guanylyltransferase
MRAVVLVGGFGTRLRPLTYSTPKPMLPIGGRPMIARLIDRLARGGVTEVVLALGFKPEPFIDAFPDGRCGDVALTYAVEPEPLDTAGAIRFAADQAGIDETFVVANGDVLTDLDVAHLIATHRRRSAEATIHLIAVDDPSSFGVVDVAVDELGAGLVRAFVEKPEPGTEPSSFINAGTYVLEPSVLELMPAGVRSSIERDVFPQVAARGGLHGVATEDYWIDAGRPELYLAANLDLLGDARRFDRCVPIDDTADVASSALVRNSIIGAGARVAADARVIDSVILPGAAVRARACVERSLVMGVVGADATVIRSMIGAEGRVDDGARLVDGAVPDDPSLI